MVLVPRIFVVDRKEYKLDIYKWSLRKRRYFRERRFLVTVGKLGSETPHGMYSVEGKSREPDWKVPVDPDYPQEIWGTIIPFGTPGNPFEGGFISLGGKESGIGIHGTSFDPKVGTASSHGCIRMRTIDFLQVYDLAKVNTPVYLH